MMAWGSDRTAGGWAGRLVLALAGFYFVLALSASYCQLSHSAEPAQHHHGHKAAAHSTLCAWACQAVSAVLAAQPEFAASPTLAVFGAPALFVRFRSACTLSRFAPRGPPLA